MAKAFLRVGLTGGIAAGKSTVASLLKKEGIKVVNLDTVGRAVVEEQPKLAVQIAEICGSQVLKNGSLNRRALREHLFNHPADRDRVEKLLHPVIWKQFEREAADTERSGQKIIVCEAALILEAGLEKKLDELIVVSAPAEIRMKRLQSRDGIDAGLASQMLSSQVDDQKRRQAATYIVDNLGDAANIAAQVEPILKGWKAKGYV